MISRKAEESGIGHEVWTCLLGNGGKYISEGCTGQSITEGVDRVAGN
jgi:hypothetical protein